MTDETMNKRIKNTNILTFVERYPHLVKEWHPTKNGNLRPEQTPIKHTIKVWWQCACGCEWEASIQARTKGYKACPQCHPRKRSQSNKSAQYIGQKYLMQSGLMIEIVGYRTYRDIDVQFSDGAMRYGVQMTHILRGNIRHPNASKTPVKTSDRLGEIKTMNCGIPCTIIAYRNCDDIDVAFDGCIVTHTKYQRFKRGSILPPREYIDTVISPSDTTTTPLEQPLNVQYINKIRRRTALRPQQRERLGTIEIALNGLLMEIIEYRKYNDITVRFEDGVCVNTTYDRFTHGRVVHPTVPSKKWGISFPEIIVLYYLQQIGFQKYAQGYFTKFHPEFNKMELDVFNEELRYAVEYDGIAFHNTPSTMNHDRKKERLCAECGIRLVKIREKGLPMEFHPNAIIREKYWDVTELENIILQIVDDINTQCKTQFVLDVNITRDKCEIIKLFTEYKAHASERIGMTSIASNGMQIKIIDYARSDNLTIEFEDGAVVSGVTYRRFMDGKVAHPSKKKNHRLGETKVSTYGETMTIIKYVNCGHIDVQFENGEVLHDITYQQFKNGKLMSEQYKKQTQDDLTQSRLGEKNIANNGIEMEIIKYIRSSDISVRFATGEVREHVTYQCFKSGRISPTTKARKPHRRLGEENVASNGQTMRIVAYRHSGSCDVEFDDGTQVCNITYNAFKHGQVSNPNLLTHDIQHQNLTEKRLNEVHYNKRGERMTIVEYISSTKVTVRFDDGTTRSGLLYSAIKRGKVLKPQVA